MADIHAVTVPKWGIEMQEGTITAWRVDENAAVEKGHDLIDIETDKIINTLEAPFSGILCRRLVGEGETLKVGALLGVIAAAGTADADIDRFIATFKPADASFAFDDAPAPNSIGHTTLVAENSKPLAPATGEKVSVSPAASRRARELGVEVSRVTGTGRGGRVSTEDVERFAQQQAGPDAAGGSAAEFEAFPFSATRRTIARRLVEAKQQIPHYYLAMDVELDAALRRRQALIDGGAGPLSVNDLILHAAVQALQAVPDCNIHVVGEEVRRFRHVNLAFAVATDRGLMTPVIPRAETLALPALAKTARELGALARKGELNHAQVEHGTFTVSNLGMFGIAGFQAVINPPQGAILAVGAVCATLLPSGAGTRVAQVLRVNLSCDHRAIDGALGATWLNRFKEFIERP